MKFGVFVSKLMFVLNNGSVPRQHGNKVCSLLRQQQQLSRWRCLYAYRLHILAWSHSHQTNVDSSIGNWFCCWILPCFAVVFGDEKCSLFSKSINWIVSTLSLFAELFHLIKIINFVCLYIPIHRRRLGLPLVPLDVAYPSVRAVVQRSIRLPCNISSTKEESSIKLILWYKNTILGSPIYSVDARERNVSQGRHFIADTYMGRARFELSLSTRTALLAIGPLRADDDGNYICRVDYRWARTTISQIKLDVIGKWCYAKCQTTVPLPNQADQNIHH